MKVKVPGELIFLLAQSLISKLLKSSATVADHKPVATLFIAQGALHEPAS